MLAIAVRTVLIYLFLTFFMRLLGKRQVGQLEIGEFVSALLLSELAAFPVADPDIPLAFALLPIALIVLLEILISALCARFPVIKKVFDGCPALLIRKGIIDQRALSKARIPPDELLAQLRLKNVSDPATVDYAILEQNGQLSVILKNPYRPLCPQDLEKHPQNEGYAVPVILCGRINFSGLFAMGLNEQTLQRKLGSLPVSEILLYTLDDAGKEYLVKYTDVKEEK